MIINNTLKSLLDLELLLEDPTSLSYPSHIQKTSKLYTEDAKAEGSPINPQSPPFNAVDLQNLYALGKYVRELNEAASERNKAFALTAFQIALIAGVILSFLAGQIILGGCLGAVILLETLILTSFDACPTALMTAPLFPFALPVLAWQRYQECRNDMPEIPQDFESHLAAFKKFWANSHREHDRIRLAIASGYQSHVASFDALIAWAKKND